VLDLQEPYCIRTISFRFADGGTGAPLSSFGIVRVRFSHWGGTGLVRPDWLMQAAFSMQRAA
jgi:hypothetical protein